MQHLHPGAWGGGILWRSYLSGCLERWVTKFQLKPAEEVKSLADWSGNLWNQVGLELTS